MIIPCEWHYEIAKLYIKLLYMKKGGNINTEKIIESKGITKSLSEIKFNLSANNLACFKGKEKTPLGKSKGDAGKEMKWLSQIKLPIGNRATN
jgi:hypothetical protein